jgi:diaminohydroxyphosphoribosylaminopyrimidine deaminase/5-amino-6-(5-phosphoribosylamino)uracil reductase
MGNDRRPRDDTDFMRLALREAARGVGLCSPNPPVGCVIVHRGEVVGKGWHRRAGAAHAEIEAFADARRRLGDKAKRILRASTLYVTLEPCSTTGRTPPCTKAILDAGIKRAVYASLDPNPEHQGRAKGILRKHGIEVTAGVLQEDADRLIRPFARRISTGLPWVIAKAGVSLDGRITRPKGESQWLTGEASRADTQKLRRRSDAIVVGAETVRKDNPHLTLRSAAQGKEQPYRVVLTRSGQLPPQARLFTDAFRERTLVYRSQSLRTALTRLSKLGVTTVLIEGGGNVLAQAFRHKLVSEVCFYIAPLISGSGKPVIDTDVFRGASTPLSEVNIRRIGDDVRVSGLVEQSE